MMFRINRANQVVMKRCLLAQEYFESQAIENKLNTPHRNMIYFWVTLHMNKGLE